MNYLLIFTALLTAIVAIRGETWIAENKGLKKITKSGWLSIALLLIFATLSAYIEYTNKSQKEQLVSREAENRIAALEIFAKQLFNIELMVAELEKENGKQALPKLKLEVSLLENSMAIHNQPLKQEERLRIQELVEFSKIELAELTNGNDFMNDLPVKELSREAKSLRLIFCNLIIEKSSFCQLVQSSITGNPFNPDVDSRMKQVIQNAQKTLPIIIKAMPKLIEMGIELDIKVKVPVKDDGVHEHIWLSHVKYKDKVFTGYIGNDPMNDISFKKGDTYTANEAYISDWMFTFKDQLYGGYMQRVTIDRMTKAEKLFFFNAISYNISSEVKILPW